MRVEKQLAPEEDGPAWLRAGAPVSWQLVLTAIIISALTLGTIMGLALGLKALMDSTHPRAYCIGANRQLVPVYRDNFDPKNPGPLLYDCKATKWAKEK